MISTASFAKTIVLGYILFFIITSYYKLKFRNPGVIFQYDIIYPAANIKISFKTIYLSKAGSFTRCKRSATSAVSFVFVSGPSGVRHHWFDTSNSLPFADHCTSWIPQSNRELHARVNFIFASCKSIKALRLSRVSRVTRRCQIYSIRRVPFGNICFACFVLL